MQGKDHGTTKQHLEKTAIELIDDWSIKNLKNDKLDQIYLTFTIQRNAPWNLPTVNQ